ncbi:aminomethyltransferase family protein [Halobaculum sp. MBLA0147]|uniref:CAF17-like 4Fe-4S cluster assembly/insertion protein YgfZ n=1 Tax=Halobaculum sp. MBLA0147 TaxID=3079934 RepID=UPI0035254404
MTLVGDTHETYGATFEERGGRRRVAHYGRPDSAVRAVRNGVGVCEMAYGVVRVEGDDRVDFVDDAVSNRVPRTDGEGVYALLLDPQGGIETELYVYNADERLLLFVPPERTTPLVEDWSEKVFIQDVSIADATEEYAVFGVHGSGSTEKVASVLNGAGAPEPPLSFVRGSMNDAGVTVIATDAPTGEEGYEVICAAADAEQVFDTLLTRGLNAAPFGYRTWETLTAEAGTPLFDTELVGQLPNVAGVRNGLDFEKGCYVGQEVVSKVENRGRPSRRLVGLLPERLPTADAAVFDGDSAVGEVTRAVDSPTLDRPVALAYVDFDVPVGPSPADTESVDADADDTTVTVRVDGEEVPATVVTLPFVAGSARSARTPTYPEAASE